MKRNLQMVIVFICLAFASSSLPAAIKYWDINGTTTGAGGSTPAGTWENVSANWNDDATGGAGGTITAWTASTVTDDTAVFSAGTDATGSFTVTVGGTYQAGFSQIVYEEGTVTIKGTTVGAAAYSLLYPPNTAGVDGTITVNSGAAAILDIGITTTAGNIVKNGPGTLTIANSAEAHFAFANVAGGSYLKINEGVYSVPTVTITTVNGTAMSKMGRATEVYLGDASTAGTLEYTGASAVWGTHATYHTAIIVGGAGGGVIDVTTAGTTLQLNRPVSGSGPFTKSGDGTLQFNAAASYTGNTTISAGTLKLNVAGAIPNGGGNGNVSISGTLDLGAFGATVNGLSGGGTVIGASVLTAGANDQTSTFSGDIGSGGAATGLTKTGAGSLTLSGNNATSGDVTVSQGTLALSGSGAAASAGTISVAGGATLDVSGVSSPPYSIGSGQTLDGSGNTGTVNGSLTLASSANLTLTYNGVNPTLDIPSGTLTINDNSVSVTVTGGALPSAASYTLVSQSGGAVAGSVNGPLIVGGDGISGGGLPSLSISGGQLILNISAGATVLKWGSGNGTWAAGVSGWNSGGTATWSDGSLAILDDEFSSGNPTITLDTAVSPAQVLVTNATTTHYTITGTGTINGASGASIMTKAGTGTLTVAVPSTIPAGVTLVAGQLNINHAAALGAATSPFNIFGGAIGNTSGGAVTVANNNAQNWNADFSFAGTSDLNLGAGAVTLSASRTVTVDANNLTVGGVIGGSGFGLTKAGSGSLTLTAANTFNGDTRIAAGVLVLANGNALQDSTLDMNSLDSGDLAFASSITTASFANLKADTSARQLVLTNASGAGVTVTFGDNNANATNNCAISGAGGITKVGAGTWLAGDGGGTAGDWTYTGDTTVSQGTVAFNDSNVLPFGAGVGNLILNGLVDNRGRTISVNGLSGTGTMNSSGTFDTTILNVGNNNASSTFTGVLSRGSAKNLVVHKLGTGTLKLTGANAIGAVSGNPEGSGVHVHAGKLIAAVSDTVIGSYRCHVGTGATLEIENIALTPSLALYLTNGATLRASGGILPAYGKSGFPLILGSASPVTMETAASTDLLNITTAISGGEAASLIVVAGPGTIILSTGSATGYAGRWKLTGGTLRLSNINSLGASGSKAIELAGGTLETRVSAAGTYSTATAVTGNAVILANQANVGSDHNFGSLSFTNDVTLTVGPGAQVTSGTETNTFTSATLEGSPTFNITNNGAIAMRVVLGAIGESGGSRSLTKNGSGQLEITGAGTYTGATTVNGGTLLVTGAGSLAAESSVAVNTGATLGGSGTINGPVTLAAGATLSPGTSVGTLTLSSNLTLSGDLFIELDKSLTPSNDVVTVAGTLTNAGTGTVTVTNLGPALANGDSFQLFNKAVLNGQALSVVSAGGIVWTNRLGQNGSIAVLSGGAAPPVAPATNLTIQAAGPNSFNVGGMGAANSAYDVYAATNITTPMSNWWLLGTTNADGGGLIQFLDPQATNAQRFYRFGQTVTP